MKLKINFWSFIFSFVCIALFFISVSWSQTVVFLTELLHIHPLNIVLGMTLMTFLFELIGFSGATNWKLLLRSISTMVITFGLSAFILYILVLATPFT